MTKPRSLQCACCGQGTIGRQWWNRDHGYGLCPECVDNVNTGPGASPTETRRSYGIRGVHYDIGFTPKAIARSITTAVNEAILTMGAEIAHPITRDVYDEALGAVPPIYGTDSGRFWLGEPHTHDSKGRPWALECWADRSSGTTQYFCRLSAVGGEAELIAC